MNDVVGSAPPAWLRIIGVLGLLWNMIGVYFYLVRVGMVGDAAAAGMDVEMSTWATTAFAVSVFGGALGSLGLVMMKSWSRLLLVLSLLGILAQDYSVISAGATSSNALAMPALVTVIGIVLAWVAHKGVKAGWLR